MSCKRRKCVSGAREAVFEGCGIGVAGADVFVVQGLELLACAQFVGLVGIVSSLQRVGPKEVLIRTMVVCGYEMQRGNSREGSDVFTMNEVDFGLHMSSVGEVLLYLEFGVSAYAQYSNTV